MAGGAVPGTQAFRSVEMLLGGAGVLRTKPHSTLDWIEVIRNGIPAAAVESLLKAMQISQSDLARALGIPERTLARRKREGVLSSEESSKLNRARGVRLGGCKRRYPSRS
jgi:putative toxin-antitoxin system antitoxin component (TIGR02293 family)